MANEEQVAAKWWANKLRAAALPGRDYARPGEVDPMAQMMTLLTAKVPNFTAEQIDQFEVALMVGLAANIWLVKRDEKFHFSLGVDYHPDQVIELAAQQVGIKTLDGYLSWKTHMWLMPGEVKVREGYGAPIVYLLGFQKAETEWQGRRILWVEDINGDRTDTLKDYPQYQQLSPEESFELFVRKPINGESE